MNYNPLSCLRIFKGISKVEQALETKTPTLGVLSRTYGEKQSEAYVKMWLVNLSESMNLKRPLKESQIDETAFLIVSEFNNITIADINLIFKRAKMGEYGSMYEALSMDKILNWFKEYFEERMMVSAARTRLESDTNRYQEDKYIGNNRKGLQLIKDKMIKKKYYK